MWSSVMSPTKMWESAASLRPKIVSLKKQWPVALVTIGLVLTIVWIVLVSWIPVRLVSSLVSISVRDILHSAL